jgi:pyruvate/2-oxoglutarate/acetoin dehydrogenase E1 component
MVAAIRESMHQAMEADPSVIVMGEDVAGGAGLGAPNEGAMGGSFGATKGLLEAFGPKRVRDTPISEAGIVGAAVGAAMAGLRPVVDVMWSSFSGLCFDQIFNQAAKMRFMSGGQVSVPVVFRMAMGAGLSAAAQHSDSLYSVFTHMPGLKVVVPSNAHDAKGLLLEAIADDDPVMFFEHMGLYSAKAVVPAEPYWLPLGSASVLQAGSDVTVVAIAAMVDKARNAAKMAGESGIEVEVIDPRTLSPLDDETILSSVAKTGRLVVVDESPPRCGIAADIAALAACHAHDALRSPVQLVTCPHTPVPFAPPLERAYIPSAEDIVSAIATVMKRT